MVSREERHRGDAERGEYLILKILVEAFLRYPLDELSDGVHGRGVKPRGTRLIHEGFHQTVDGGRGMPGR